MAGAFGVFRAVHSRQGFRCQVSGLSFGRLETHTTNGNDQAGGGGRLHPRLFRKSLTLPSNFRLQQTKCPSAIDRLHPVAHVELTVDTLNVCFHRILRDN